MARRKPRAVSLLLSEGSSLSARQAISALGPLGYTIDLCDPNPFCLGRFSRFVRRVYRSPASGTDPAAYLQFILRRLEQDRYDVLLPVNEQAFLFARVQRRLSVKAGLALAGFDQFALLQSKAAFSRVLTRLDLPRPLTRLVRSRSEIEGLDGFPYYIKTPFGTAGRGVWRVDHVAERSRVIGLLEEGSFFDGKTDIVVQDIAPGVQCQAQALFEHGRLIAAHCTSQLAVGVGGSQSARLSVDHPVVRSHLERIGRHLCWHGAMALDYFFEPAANQPLYIEANPRLVEPMNAVLSGVNLADLLARLSMGESFKNGPVRLGRFGVRSHSLMATLLGLADQHGTRLKLLGTLGLALFKKGAYAESKEDLTPVLTDPAGLIPLSIISLQLLMNPARARRIAGQTVSDYSLTQSAIETIYGLEESQGETSR